MRQPCSGQRSVLPLSFSHFTYLKKLFYTLIIIKVMAILFEWYETPAAPDQPEKNRIHARISLNGCIGTEEISEKIQYRCSLTKTDVTAVLDALSDILGDELGNGRQVHLDGIGYFHPTLKCTETVTPETKRKNTKVQLKSIRFRADKTLKSNIGNVKLKNVRHGGHSRKLSDVEVDIKLKEYFATHTVMTRSEFQHACGFMKSTAMAHLRRLRTEGKIQNINIPTQPIYVPGRDITE